MMILDHENKHFRSFSAYVMWGDKQLQHLRKFTILWIVRGDTFGFHFVLSHMCGADFMKGLFIKLLCGWVKLFGWLFSGFVSTALN